MSDVPRVIALTVLLYCAIASATIPEAPSTDLIWRGAPEQIDLDVCRSAVLGTRNNTLELAAQYFSALGPELIYGPDGNVMGTSPRAFSTDEVARALRALRALKVEDDE